MNKEKLAKFIELIDYAIHVAKERRQVLNSDKFIEILLEKQWIKKEDFDQGKEFVQEKYEFYFSFEWLDNNIIGQLEAIKNKAISNGYEDRLNSRPKGNRGGFGITRGMSDYSDRMWGEALYDYAIYNACGEVEKYFNRELE